MSPNLNRSPQPQPLPPPPPPLPPPTTNPKPTEPNQPQTTHTREPQQTIQPPYLSKWSRAQIQNAVDNGQAVSIYVENIQCNWKPVDICKIMSKYGEVMDVYVPMKRTKRGLKFCFVRSKGIKDIQRLLYDINRIHVETGIIRANMARERKQHRQPTAAHRFDPRI
ncbi:hypothetical protein Tsubulata_051504 [Turnera subulata]|uniref:RRM domain-containing protein n=1 Tax=Turnera subulata TaxID=218843 RepID=A0A9Q0JB32_9ROSI|nr:hypothetical protein Tsubulata_051504 [Turnera subulata]